MSYSIAVGDEAGDVGFRFGRGSSDYFVFALVLTEDPERVRDQLSALKKRLRMRPDEEFKFFKMSNSRRAKFFEGLRPVSYTVQVMTLYKPELGTHWRTMDKTEFVSEVVSILISRIEDKAMNNRVLILDEFDEIGRTDLRVRQKLRVRGLAVRRVLARSSKTDALFQLADMCAGSVMRSLTTGRAFHAPEQTKFHMMGMKTENPPPASSVLV